MLTLRAKYEKGKIQLIEPMPDEIETADLSIAVMSYGAVDSSSKFSAGPGNAKKGNSEDEFKQIGLAAFFDTNDDADVDWEQYFGLK